MDGCRVGPCTRLDLQAAHDELGELRRPARAQLGLTEEHFIGPARGLLEEEAKLVAHPLDDRRSSDAQPASARRLGDGGEEIVEDAAVAEDVDRRAIRPLPLDLGCAIAANPEALAKLRLGGGAVAAGLDAWAAAGGGLAGGKANCKAKVQEHGV